VPADTDELLVVFAHKWLNNVAMIAGAASTLLESHDELGADDRRFLVGAIRRQAESMEDSLLEVFAAARPDLRVALQALQQV
jgi:hypothetical protein